MWLNCTNFKGKHTLYMSPAIVGLVVFIYFMVLIGISFLTSRNASANDFYTASRQSPWYLVAFGMIWLVSVSHCRWLLADQVWSISPALELLPLNWSCRRPFASGGSNSDADKVNQTWSRHLVGNQSQTSVNDEILASSHRCYRARIWTFV